MQQPIGICTTCLYALERAGDVLLPWLWNVLSALQGGVWSQFITLGILWTVFFLMDKVFDKLAKWFNALLQKFEK